MKVYVPNEMFIDHGDLVVLGDRLPSDDHYAICIAQNGSSAECGEWETEFQNLLELAIYRPEAWEFINGN